MEHRNYTDEDDLRQPTPRVRLQWMKSPVIGSTESHNSIVEPDLPGGDIYHKNATLGAAGFATYRGEPRGLPLFRKVSLIGLAGPVRRSNVCSF